MRQEKNNSRVLWRRHLYFPVLTVVLILLVWQTRHYFVIAGIRWAYVLSLSTALSFCLTPVFSRIARKYDLMDKPDPRKIHPESTPLLGGASVFIAFIAGILINGIFSFELGSILTGSTILFAIGIVDDFKDIPAWIKLVLQILCSILVVMSGVILRVIPESLGIFALICNLLLTVFWIIGITNAMNFFDGMDGLAAGLGAIISFFLGVVAFQTGQPFIGWISVGMMGSCLGFLPYNFKMKGNASIFLGDAGSTIIGFILACVAVYGDWAQGNPVVALISPLLIFWILIFDMLYITVDRILTGKVKTIKEWIDYVGKDHLHHRLARVLGSHKNSVFFIYLISMCLGVSAVVLRNARPMDAVLLIIQASILVVLISILERCGR